MDAAGFQTPTRSFLWNGEKWVLSMDQLAWCVLEHVSGEAYLDYADRIVKRERHWLRPLQVMLYALTASHRVDNRLSFPRTEMDKDLSTLVPLAFIRKLPKSLAAVRSLRLEIMGMLEEEDLLCWEPPAEPKPAAEVEQGGPQAPLDPDPSSTGNVDSQTALPSA